MEVLVKGDVVVPRGVGLELRCGPERRPRANHQQFALFGGWPLAAGRAANLVVFDPAAEWVVGEKGFVSMARNSAFTGRRVHGRVLHTLFNGIFTVREGEPAR